ncbi:predicted protein [Nematostella vectensis]|uniref:Mitochondrial assembly of ribosomal large subunit protein 1 n=1 Tax=Nematostella vectensis TaxID=45351 RepID=A7SFH4_NEMVE|nr:predicted protein [Nematostella vectensis]|eukprot:XP_001629641.1 predicted protein [Nematostella vectensis]
MSVSTTAMSQKELKFVGDLFYPLELVFRGYETRGVGKHGHVTVEGLDSNYWLVVDIGNMVVHFFLPEARELYELEKLWVLGPRFDDQYKAMMEHDEFLQTVYLGDKSKVEEDVKPDES